MHGVFILDQWEWRLLYGLHSDGENKGLPPGTGKGTVEKALAKGYIEKWTKGTGSLATTYWRRTAKGTAALDHDARLHRAMPSVWGQRTRK